MKLFLTTYVQNAKEPSMSTKKEDARTPEQLTTASTESLNTTALHVKTASSPISTDASPPQKSLDARHSMKPTTSSVKSAT